MYKFGSFLLNENTVQLSKRNKVLNIEPLAYNLLLLLIKNRNRVVKKQELLDALWGSRPVTDYVITRIVYQLRKTIDENETDSCIRTVRGKGHQFVGDVT